MKELKPNSLWAYFEEILEIPRISKSEEKIIKYLEEFSQKNKLDFKKDATGNCLITKAAKPGYEDRQTIVLQSHLDMVGEKLLEVSHDFHRDPIQVEEKDGWITAKGTTLGADDGIGIAASMAILTDDSIKHGPVECLFTVDEETGMTGAFGLEKGFFEGKILLNLDSEDEGEIFIGCAGGIDTLGRFKKRTKLAPGESAALKLTLDGLQGGHSGDEIHKGFANAIKVLNQVLYKLDRHTKISLASFTGGKLRNAIPRDAEAVIVFPLEDTKMVKDFLTDFSAKLEKFWIKREPGFNLLIEEIEKPETCYMRSFQKSIMQMIFACPHGVISWSKDIPELVETSSNLAVLKEDGIYLELVTSQRSSNDFAKEEIADRMAALIKLGNGKARHSDGYPGWNPNPDSQILSVSKKAYERLFNKAAEVKAIHAGLECGLFLQKYPDLDMISIGPTIKGAHTPEERIEIASVQKFWDFLLEILENAPIR